MAESVGFRVDLGWVRSLAKRYPAAYRRETVNLLDLIVRRLEDSVVEKIPRGIGGEAGLAGSVFGEVNVSGREIKGIVGTPFEYGTVIEFGRRPGMGMPPVEPIKLWAQHKLGLTEEEADSAAWAIAKKISIQGFEGAQMFTETLQEHDDWIMRMLATLPDRIVRRVSRGQG